VKLSVSDHRAGPVVSPWSGQVPPTLFNAAGFAGEGICAAHRTWPTVPFDLTIPCRGSVLRYEDTCRAARDHAHLLGIWQCRRIALAFCGRPDAEARPVARLGVIGVFFSRHCGFGITSMVRARYRPGRRNRPRSSYSYLESPVREGQIDAANDPSRTGEWRDRRGVTERCKSPRAGPASHVRFDQSAPSVVLLEFGGGAGSWRGIPRVGRVPATACPLARRGEEFGGECFAHQRDAQPASAGSQYVKLLTAAQRSSGACVSIPRSDEVSRR